MNNQTKKNPRRKRIHSLFYRKYINLLGISFIAMLIIIPLVSLLLPDGQFSPDENRILTQWPKFSLDSFADGRYMKKAEKYTADQFVGRTSWIKTKTNTDRLLGKNVSNNVYLGKDGTLIESFDPLPAEDLDKTQTAINGFVDKHPTLNHYFMVAPNAISIDADKLPDNAPVINQKDSISAFTAGLNANIKILNPTSILEANKDQLLYYKTDHHWTTLGAWLAFQGVAADMGIKPNLDAYTVYPVTKNFAGALVSKSGYSLKNTDTIEVYIPKSKEDYSVVSYVEEQTKSPSLYNSEQLKGKDKYAVFLDGNHPLMTIKNPVNNGRNLLVIKDSYANAFIPFLTPYFSEITVLDPRYYYDSIDVLISESEITDILYLYNANTFFNDTSLEPVLNDK
ncbi:MAG: DHHW family protein [Acetobacterium sp.]